MLNKRFAEQLLPGLLFLLLLTACYRRTSPELTPPLPLPEPAPTAEEASPLPPEPSAPYLILQLKKTPCFGSCPVFEATVYSDGRAIWQGERHHPRLGTYQATASPQWIAGVMAAAEEARYFSLESAYPAYGGPIPDLPQTITIVHRGRKSHRIVDNADAPPTLLRFEKALEEKLEALDWLKSN